MNQPWLQVSEVFRVRVRSVCQGQVLLCKFRQRFLLFFHPPGGRGTVHGASSHLHWEPAARDAVLRACRAVALPPVELDLLCLEAAGKSRAAHKVVVLQQDSNYGRNMG